MILNSRLTTKNGAVKAKLTARSLAHCVVNCWLESLLFFETDVLMSLVDFGPFETDFALDSI